MAAWPSRILSSFLGTFYYWREIDYIVEQEYIQLSLPYHISWRGDNEPSCKAAGAVLYTHILHFSYCRERCWDYSWVHWFVEFQIGTRYRVVGIKIFNEHSLYPKSFTFKDSALRERRSSPTSLYDFDNLRINYLIRYMKTFNCCCESGKWDKHESDWKQRVIYCREIMSHRTWTKPCRQTSLRARISLYATSSSLCSLLPLSPNHLVHSTSS